MAAAATLPHGYLMVWRGPLESQTYDGRKIAIVYRRVRGVS